MSNPGVMILKILKNIVIKRKKPTKIWFELTRNCNSHCVHCNIWQEKHRSDELNSAEIFRIFSDPLFSDVDMVIVSGGEPTTRNDLADCLISIHNALPKALIQLSTNGLRPEYTLSVVKELLDIGAKINIGVSIDGLGEDHDAVRGQGSWKRLTELIDGLIELRDIYPNLSVTGGTVLSPHTTKNINKITMFYHLMGIDYLIQWMNQSLFYNNLELDVDRSEERKIVESLDELRFGMLKEKWLDWLDGKPIKFKCYALRDFLVIQSNGDVVPCLTYWTWCIGNLRYDPPLKVWESWLREKALITVKNCPGCLNSWGTYWSWESDGWPYIRYYLRHPVQLLRKWLMPW